MRYLMPTLLLATCVALPAHATEKRILVNDVHTYVASINQALNHPDVRIGQDFLHRTLSERAVFENNVQTRHASVPYGHVPHNPYGAYALDPAYGYGYANRVYGTYGGQGYYGYHASRYPQNWHSGWYNTASLRQMTKADKIADFSNKKRLIAGYNSEFVVTGVRMQPYAESAVVDVDLKEYSLHYSAYTPQTTRGVLHAASRCKMYLSKQHESLYMTRMDCNTNAHFPL